VKPPPSLHVEHLTRPSYRGLLNFYQQQRQQQQQLRTHTHIVLNQPSGAYEVAILGLAAALQAASESGEHKELQTNNTVAAANDARTKVAIELSGKRRVLAEVRVGMGGWMRLNGCMDVFVNRL